MRLAAWPGNQRASAVHTNVPAQHDDTDFYGDVSASLKISGSRFCYTPPPKFQNAQHMLGVLLWARQKSSHTEMPPSSTQIRVHDNT